MPIRLLTIRIVKGQCKIQRINQYGQKNCAPHILTVTALDMFSQDIYASHIRQTLLSEKLEKPVLNEYNQPICIL